MLQRPPLAAFLFVVAGLLTTSCSSLTELLYMGRLEWGPRESNGQQTGLWKYWYDPAHEHLRAQGNFEDDKPVGRWEFFHENGAKRWEVAFRDEAYDGPTTAWWPNGTMRSQGAFTLGFEQGPWTYWDDAGRKTAEGSFERGARDGTWRTYATDGTLASESEFENGAVKRATAVVAEPLPTPVPTSATPLAAPVQRPLVVVEIAPPTPPIGVVAAPFTTTTTGQAAEDPAVSTTVGYSIEELTEIFSTGKSEVAGSGGGYASSDPRNPPTNPKRDAEKSDDFEGKPLPWTRIVQGDGTTLDLASFRGKSKVLLVVLRGLKGKVCEYCTAQTQALQGRADEFKRANCEVVIVYPGPAERLGEFLSETRAYYEGHYGTSQPETTCRLACDEGFQLVERLGLLQDLAIPAAFVIDRDSMVSFAWVSKDKQDRPSCKTLLDEVREAR